MSSDGSARVRWRSGLLVSSGVCLSVAGVVFVAEIVLARVIPDAPPYLLLDAPSEVAGWVMFDRLLFSVVCVGLLAAGAVAGAAATVHRAAVCVALVSTSVVLVGLLLGGVFWGTSETAQDLDLSVPWLGPASLIAAMLTALAGAAIVAAGLVLGLLTRRSSVAATYQD